MAHHSVIYRLISQSAFGDDVRNQELGTKDQGLVDLSRDNVRQTFNPGRRLKAVNLDSPEVQEGLRISKIAYSEMKAICASRNIEFLVVLIPTKDLVYSGQIENRFKDSMTSEFVALVKNEISVRDDMSKFFTDQKIDFVDLLPVLRQSVLQSENIYPFNDGHPNGFGYSVIAAEINVKGLQGLH